MPVPAAKVKSAARPNPEKRRTEREIKRQRTENKDTGDFSGIFVLVKLSL